jgi:iron(III) transport system permease protein
VLLVHTYSMYVYFFVLVGGALLALDESQIEAARDLGASRGLTFRRVVLPHLVPALAGASLLTFMTSMASFTAPYYYMAGRPVLTVGIQQAAEDSMDGLASADCVVLAVCAGIFLIMLLGFEKTIQGGTRGAARRRRQLRSPVLRWAIFAGALATTLVLLAPHFSMIRESFIKRGTGFIGVPVEYTFENYVEIWSKPDLWQPFANSLRAASMATVGVVRSRC